VYASSVKEKKLTFQVSGYLWRRSLIMRDLETGTLWSHLLGRAMRGELKDMQLETIPASMTTWANWKARHPKTSLLAMTRTVDRYTEAAWEQPKSYVFGLLLGSGNPAPAVSLERLQRDRIVTFKVGEEVFVATHDAEGGSVQAFTTTTDEKTLTFSASGERQMKDAETGSEWNPVTGEAFSGPMKGKALTPISGTISFLKAWEVFHPDEIVVR